MAIVINADDYGLNKTTTDAIIKSFELGLLDTTTIICNQVDSGCFDYAIDKIKRSNYSECVGIHLNITEGKPLTEEMRMNSLFCDEKGYFRNNRQLRLLNKHNKKILYNELHAQITKLEETGLKIHHADSHHHIHTYVGYTDTFIRVLKDHNINKLRCSRNIGKIILIKKIYKALFNNILLMNEISYTSCFGSLEDIKYCKKMDLDIELMCHPYFNLASLLMNRSVSKNHVNSSLLKEQIDYIKKI